MANTTRRVARFARDAARSPKHAAELVVARLTRRPPASYMGDGRVLITTQNRAHLLIDGRDISIAPSLIATGDFDPPFTWFLRRTLRAGDTYVDVGANIGLYVVTAAKHVGPAGRVIAFEPSPRMQGFLGDNIAMNGQKNQVSVRPVAVGAASGRAVLGVPRNAAGVAALGLTNLDDFPVGVVIDEIDVPVVCLDDDLATAGSVSVLKIDVEGGEGNVLVGMRRLIAERRVQTIVLEVNQRAHDRTGNQSGWDTMARELHALDSEGYSWSTLDRLGARCATTLEQALTETFIAHLLADAPL